jgi:hypothetical protein
MGPILMGWAGRGCWGLFWNEDFGVAKCLGFFVTVQIIGTEADLFKINMPC